MREASLGARAELSDRIVRQYTPGENVLITGPNGIGRSYLLESIQRGLQARGVTTVLLHCRDRDAVRRIQEADPSSAFLIDGLEHAQLSLLRALGESVGRGSSAISALEVGNQRNIYSLTLSESSDELHETWMGIESFHRIRLDPLTDQEMERLLHRRSSEMLDSSTVRTITSLARGRPRWALDLLTLARSGHLDTGPVPAISSIPLGEHHLPAMQSLTKSVGALPQEAASAAIALSEVDPLDFIGIEELIGSEVANLLLDRGVLLPSDKPDLFTVPGFLAAALRPQAPPRISDQFRRRISDRLLAQESLGLPLSEADTAFCARNLQVRAVDADTAFSPALTPAQAKLLGRATSSLLSFGGGQTRTLLLRSGDPGVHCNSFTRARALTVLGDPSTGLAALESFPVSSDTEESVARLFLLALLRAEVGDSAPRLRPPADTDSPAVCTSIRDAAFVFGQWNSRAAVADDLERLRIIAGQHEVDTVARLAETLVDLETVWRGQLPAAPSWLRRGSPIPGAAAYDPELSRDMLGTILLAQALTVLLSGETALRGSELMRMARKTPSPSYHSRWIAHLIATGSAIACGNVERAVLEWELLLQRIPRFLPVRLREFLRSIEDALRLVADPSSPPAASAPGATLPHRLVSYLCGQHEFLMRTRAENPRGNEPLPVIRLANVHLTAVEQQNPAELIRAAERLQGFELWAPATYALKEAKRILLSRRATGGVGRCDDALDGLERNLIARVPWYRPRDLPTSNHVQLTPREQTTASLAAKGLSNREIAEQLACSVRTVESHLAQARAKLGASTRHELTNRLAHAI